jgi:hypothetical protein
MFGNITGKKVSYQILFVFLAGLLKEHAMG